MTERDASGSRTGTAADARTIGRRSLIYLAGIATSVLSGCGDIVEPIGDDDHYDIHEHGTLVVQIDGEPVDFSREKYVYPDSHPNPDFPRFHFHRGSDDRWHMETDERLTFAEALDALPETSFERGSGGLVLSIEGETYDESDDAASIETLADEETVDPLEYEIQDGDDLRVEVES